MTGRLPHCSQHESPGEPGAPSRRSGTGLYPLPARIDLSYLTRWAQRSSSASWRAPLAWRQRTTASGQVLHLYRPGRRDVAPRSAGPRASGLADRFPVVTASRGPTGGPATECERGRGLSALADTQVADSARPTALPVAGVDARRSSSSRHAPPMTLGPAYTPGGELTVARQCGEHSIRALPRAV